VSSTTPIERAKEQLSALVAELGINRVLELLCALASDQEALDVPSDAKQFRTSLAVSGRTAIWLLYRFVRTLISREGLQEEESLQQWKQLAHHLISFLDAIGASSAPTRLSLYYTIENRVFNPLVVEVEYYLGKPIRRVYRLS